MKLVVSSVIGEVRVAGEDELARALHARRQSGDELWICRENADYPALAVLTRDEHAHITYFPVADAPGWVARGDSSARFTVDAIEHYELQPPHVVSFDDALQAATRFCRAPDERPAGFDWEPL